MRVTLKEKLDGAFESFLRYRFCEAYRSYRRCFDQLPFLSDRTLYADHIGAFVRTLAELGKTQELNFYASTLEQLYAKNSSPSLGYPLAVLYTSLDQPRIREARPILERIVRSASPSDLVTKAKMVLARLAPEKTETITLIRSITNRPEEPSLAALLEIWIAIVLRYEGKLEQAKTNLENLLLQPIVQSQWYCRFSAQHALVMTLFEQKEFINARSQMDALRTEFSKRSGHSVNEQLKILQTRYETFLQEETIELNYQRSRLQLAYAENRFAVKNPGLVRLINVFRKKPTVRRARLCRLIDPPEPLLEQFVVGLSRLGLPIDCLMRSRTSFSLLPKLVAVGVKG